MAKRYAKPPPELKFMRPQEFEDEAALILAEYGNAHGNITEPPIPIDEVVEHFQLVLEYQDLQASYPEGDVLGAIYFNDKRIVIDQALVPEENPSMRGRYNFTLAHEFAHRSQA